MATAYIRKQGGRGLSRWHQLACYGPQLVLVVVGTNDLLHAPGYGSAIGLDESQLATGFRHGITSTLSSLLALPSQPHVVLLDPPPIGPAAAAHKEHACLNKLTPSLLAGVARGLTRVHHLSGRARYGVNALTSSVRAASCTSTTRSILMPSALRLWRASFLAGSHGPSLRDSAAHARYGARCARDVAHANAHGHWTEVLTPI